MSMSSHSGGMKIGDVAEQTGVPARMIRYYEQQGLLEPERGDNGYRVYTSAHVDRVRRIRNHISAGLPTRLVKIVFEMEQPGWSPQCDSDFAEQLTTELAEIDERIACLSLSRKTIASVLEQVGAGTDNSAPESDKSAS